MDINFFNVLGHVSDDLHHDFPCCVWPRKFLEYKCLQLSHYSRLLLTNVVSPIAVMVGMEAAQELWIRPREWARHGQKILRERAPFPWA